ncbi:MAG: sulfotransferase family protein [Solimonas sp.]
MLKNVPVPPPQQLTPRGRAFAYPPSTPAELAGDEVERRWPLDPATLMERARDETGLQDFGSEPFREPLRRLCASLAQEVDLNAAGRENAYRRLMNILVTRLRLEALWKKRPEILTLPVRAPIFIVGLPRSGTTFLQWMLARDATLRHAPFWELMFPLPFGEAEAPVSQPDPRIAAARAAIHKLHEVAPEMVKMHQLEAEEPEEEIALLSLGFCSMAFEWSFAVPSYVDYYRKADHTDGYAYFRKVLQTLQWLRGGEQWVLKAPMHMENLKPLLAVFPDAVIVQTHRDPVTTTVSLSSLTCYGIRNYFDHPNPLLVGRNISAIIERLLRGICRDRGNDDPRFVDVQFRELMQDPIAAVRRIYAAAGKSLAADDEQRMRAWIAANPRDKNGGHDYSAEDFGIDMDERREALRFYTERFGVGADRKA